MSLSEKDYLSYLSDRERKEILSLRKEHPWRYYLKMIFVQLCCLFCFLVWFITYIFLFLGSIISLIICIAFENVFFLSLFVFFFFLAILICFSFHVFNRSRRPDGLLLVPEEYARLHDDIRSLCMEMGIAPFRRIYLDMNYQVEVFSRSSSFSFFARDSLVIGYPLICALDTKSFRICLARVFRHEQSRFFHEFVLKFTSMLWELAFTPILLNTWFRHSVFPLQIQKEQDCEAYCREKYGERENRSFVTQAWYRGTYWTLRGVLLKYLDPSDRMRQFPPLRLLSEYEKVGNSCFNGDPATVIRKEIRRKRLKDNPEDILNFILKESNQEDTLPAFRERVGMVRANDLLPFLDNTPDAAEYYLDSCPAFRKEFEENVMHLMFESVIKEDEIWHIFPRV